MRRLYHVALFINDAQRDEANEAVVSVTGNPADIYSFALPLVHSDSSLWWGCVLPIRGEYFHFVHDFQQQIGGIYEILTEFDPRTEIMTLDDALALHGIAIVQEPEDE